MTTPEGSPQTQAVDDGFREAFLGRATTADLKRLDVKGNLVAARRRYVEDTWGKAGVARVVARLEGDARRVFESPPLPFVWINATVLAVVDEAIVVACMEGDVSQMRPFGSAIARADLPVLYRVFFHVGAPWMVVKAAGTMFPLYFRCGAVVASSIDGFTGGAITLTNAMLPRYLCRDGIAGWLEAALELSGARDVRIVHDRCVHEGNDRCGWRLSWTR